MADNPPFRRHLPRDAKNKGAAPGSKGVNPEVSKKTSWAQGSKTKNDAAKPGRRR